MTYSRGPENSIETACVVVVGFRIYDASWPLFSCQLALFHASWHGLLSASSCCYPARAIEASDR